MLGVGDSARGVDDRAESDGAGDDVRDDAPDGVRGDAIDGAIVGAIDGT